MRSAFCEYRKLEREARKSQQIEFAILIIRLEKPVERQQSRQQCRDPGDAGIDALQDLRLGTDAEREQHDGENKEADDKTGVAALAQGKAQIAPEEAEKHPHANIITRAIGADIDELVLDKVSGRLQQGDRFLLCSDGLCKTVPFEQLMELLRGDDGVPPPQSLVAAALALDVTDNVTAVAIEVP